MEQQLDDTKGFAIVVPTLNEAATIKVVLERLVSALTNSSAKKWEIVVVDDESSDRTGDVVKRFAQGEPRVRLLMRIGQRGLAGAITHGWLHTNAEVLGVMDADLQHPPEVLQILIEKINEGYDLAIASRYVQPHSVDQWNPFRAMISRMSLVAAKPVQKHGLRVKDPMSGFFVLRRKCISGLEFQPTGFKLLLEILARGNVDSVVEVPFKFAPRRKGKSKANVMTAVHYFSLLRKLMFKNE